MTMSENDGRQDALEPPRVAFSLGKKKGKSKKAPSAISEFGQEDEGAEAVKKNRTVPLVIPLLEGASSGARDGYLTGRSHASITEQSNPTSGKSKDGDDSDAAAAQALLQSATDHFASRQQASENGTNFSAQGTLVIAQQQKIGNNSEAHVDTEAQQLQRDLESRPDDIPVDSNAYDRTPISEFGAAMLRGMGWTGVEDAAKKGDADETMPRPHRLGLGATPKLPASTGRTPGQILRPGQAKQEARLMKQHQEYEARRETQMKQDKQRTLQDGSIVQIENGKRARMIKLMGVPGLNRVMVHFEGETDPTSIKRGDVVGLVERLQLEERPFHEQKSSPSMNGGDDEKRSDHGDDRRNETDRGDDRKRQRSREAKDSERQRRREKDRERSRGDKSRDSKKRRKMEEPEHWLLTNIQVRVITEKLGRHQYKQKGLVLDVTHGGAYATLQMMDGRVMDRVPERYLETGLPKLGGSAIVLTGRHKFSKGKLIERDSKSGRGVVQMFEDMSVVTLSLDDIAEWCGPLDDTIE